MNDQTDNLCQTDPVNPPGRVNAASARRTIRLDDAMVDALVGALHTAPVHDAAKRRQAPRFRVRMPGCTLSYTIPGSATASHFTVIPVDLSETGIAFLYGGFIYSETKCALRLSTLYGSWNVLGAVTRNCQLVRGTVHKVGASFTEKINPTDYCHEALSLQVLVADDSPMITRLVQAFLKDRQATIDSVSNGRLALEYALGQSYDVVLMDIEMPEMDGIEAVVAMRAGGYARPIVAMTSTNTCEMKEKCMQAGFDLFMPKPLTRNGLMAVIDSFQREPLISTLAHDPNMTGLIAEFIESLEPMCRKLEIAVIKGDLQAIRQTCRRLKGSAGTFGFEPIVELATEVGQLYLEDADAKARENGVNALIRLCNSARG